MATAPARCALVAACILAVWGTAAASSCDEHTHCGDCLADEDCGWCDAKPRLEACVPVHGDPKNVSLCAGCLHHASLGGCGEATTRCDTGAECGGCTQQPQCAWRLSPSGPACLPLTSTGRYCPKAAPKEALCVENGDQCAWTDRCPVVPIRNCTAAASCADCTSMAPDCVWCANASDADAITGRCLPRGGSDMPVRTRGHGVCTSCAAASPSQCAPAAPPCSSHASCAACKDAGDGRQCAWCLSTQSCVAIASNSSAFPGRACGGLPSSSPCPSAQHCLLRSAGAPLAAADPSREQCPPDCGAVTTCVACTRASSDAQCGWSAAMGACVPLGRFGRTGRACASPATVGLALLPRFPANGSMRYSPQQCTPLERKTGPGRGCQSLTSCSECAGANGCGWCGALRRCLPTQILAEGCTADLATCAVRDVTDAAGIPLMATGPALACRNTLLWRSDQASAACPVSGADTAPPCEQRGNCSACVAESEEQAAAGAYPLCAWCEERSACLPLDRNGTAMSTGNGSIEWRTSLTGPCSGCGRTNRSSCPAPVHTPARDNHTAALTQDVPCAARASCASCLHRNASAGAPQAGCAWCTGSGRCVAVQRPGDIVPRGETGDQPGRYCSSRGGCVGCALLSNHTTLGVPARPRAYQCPVVPGGTCSAARNCSECAAPENEGVCAWSATHGRCVAVQRKHGAACATHWLSPAEARAARQCFVYEAGRCPEPGGAPCAASTSEDACLAERSRRNCTWCEPTRTCLEQSTWFEARRAPVCALLAWPAAKAFPGGLHANATGSASHALRHVPGTRLMLPTCPAVRISKATGWQARADPYSWECFARRPAAVPCSAHSNCAACAGEEHCVWLTGSGSAASACRRGSLHSPTSLSLCFPEDAAALIGGCPAAAPSTCADATAKAAASKGGSSGEDTCLLAQVSQACSGGTPTPSAHGPPFTGSCSCPSQQHGAQCSLCDDHWGGPGCALQCPGCSFQECSSSVVCGGFGTCVGTGRVSATPACKCRTGYVTDPTDGSCRSEGCVCDNGGTCPGGGTTCSCPGNYGGAHCERCKGSWRGADCEQCPTEQYPNILPSCLDCKGRHYGFNCTGTCRPCATPGCDRGVRGTGNCTCSDGSTACATDGRGVCDALTGSCTCVQRGRYGTLCEADGSSAGILAGCLLGVLLVVVTALGGCMFKAKVHTVVGVHDRFKANFAKGLKGDRPTLSADTAISVVSQLFHDAQLGGMAFDATVPWGENAKGAQLSISGVLLLSLPYFTMQGLFFWSSVALAAVYVAYSAVFFRAGNIRWVTGHAIGRFFMAPAPYVAWTVQTLSIILLRQIASPLNCVYHGPPGYPPFLLSSAPNELSRAAVVYSAQEVGEPDTYSYWSSVMPLDSVTQCWEGKQVSEAVVALLVLVPFFPTLAWVRPLLAANPLTSAVDPSDNAAPIEIAYHPSWLFVQLVVDIFIACIGTFFSAFPAVAFFLRVRFTARLHPHTRTAHANTVNRRPWSSHSSACS